MVEAQDENNFCLVAEAGGKAIAFMSICAEVNVPFLQVSVCYKLHLLTNKISCKNSQCQTMLAKVFDDVDQSF